MRVSTNDSEALFVDGTRIANAHYPTYTLAPRGGYKFVPTYQKGVKGKYKLVVSDKSWKQLKQNLKSITKKTTPQSVNERISKLKEVCRGWLNYFRMASISGKLRDIDGWLRNRLRYCIWADWKKPE